MRLTTLRLTLILASLLFPALAAAADGPSWPQHRLRGAGIDLRATEDDLAHLAGDWKANSVRILANNIVPDQPPYLVPEEQKAQLYATIDRCLAQGLYVVFSPSSSFWEMEKFFANEELKDAFIAFWEEFATRYKDDRRGIAYDLMNEPNGELALQQWNDYAKKITRAIRAIDTLHTLVVEPAGWGWPQWMDRLEPTGDPNTVYSFHYYGPMDYTHQRNDGHMKTTAQQQKERVYPGFLQGERHDRDKMRQVLQDVIRFRDKHGVTLWCGEFGCARWANGADRWFHDWIEALEEENIGWAYYAYREWEPMDIEMDPAVRGRKTERSETPIVKVFKSFYARNEN